jgi:hypothetical protein
MRQCGREGALRVNTNLSKLATRTAHSERKTSNLRWQNRPMQSASAGIAQTFSSKVPKHNSLHGAGLRVTEEFVKTFDAKDDRGGVADAAPEHTSFSCRQHRIIKQVRQNCVLRRANGSYTHSRRSHRTRDTTLTHEFLCPARGDPPHSLAVRNDVTRTVRTKIFWAEFASPSVHSY